MLVRYKKNSEVNNIRYNNTWTHHTLSIEILLQITKDWRRCDHL